MVGGFVGPTQKPLTAHFTTEVGEGVVRADAGSAPSGDGGTTAVDTGDEVVPTFGAGTTGFATTVVFVGAGPPIAFCCIGPGPPTTTGLLGPPTGVCATAGWEKSHAQRKMTDITALFIRSILVGNLPLAGVYVGGFRLIREPSAGRRFVIFTSTPRAACGDKPKRTSGRF